MIRESSSKNQKMGNGPPLLRQPVSALKNRHIVWMDFDRYDIYAPELLFDAVSSNTHPSRFRLPRCRRTHSRFASSALQASLRYAEAERDKHQYDRTIGDPAESIRIF